MAAVDLDGAGPRLFFETLATSEPEQIPIHRGLNAADRVADVERPSQPRATVVETETNGPYTGTWTVMCDPEGNGFPVQSPEA